MSRHRQVPRLIADAYDEIEDYDRYDDNYEESEVVPENVQQYLWKGDRSSSTATTSLTAPTLSAKQCSHNNTDGDDGEDVILEMLVEDVRDVLQDNTLSQQEIERALIASDYNPEVVVATLLDRRNQEDNKGVSAVHHSKLESTNPSQIGRIIDSDETVNDHVEHGGDQFPPLPALGNQFEGSFKFDVPSPDDVILAQKIQGKKGDSKLRLPAPSTRKFGRIRARPTAKRRESGIANSPEKDGGKGEDLTNVANEFNSLNISDQGTSEKESEGQEIPTGVPNVKQRIKKIDLSVVRDPKSIPYTAVVVGHVDAGKSTLLGHLLQRTGAIGHRSSKKKVRNLAWVTDEDAVERERGVTIDISSKTLRLPRSGRMFIMIDAPGHRDFVPAMILGASQASAAILVVDSSVGEFEAGFSEQGQTREHTIVLRALGVTKLIVVINKMDTTNFSKSRYDEIKGCLHSFFRSTGFLVAKNVSFIPCSAINGVNLVDSPEKAHPLADWYKGWTVLDSLEALAENPSNEDSLWRNKPTRLVVSDAYRSKSMGGTVTLTGRVVCGIIAVTDNLLKLPGCEIVRVKAIETCGERRKVIVAGIDNEPVSISVLAESELSHVDAGAVLCDPEYPVPLAATFHAQVVIFNVDRPITQGSKAVLHLGGGSEAAVFSKLIALVGKEKREGGKKRGRPRRLIKGDSAMVEIKTARPVCVETYSNVRPLGRFTLRDRGRTIAAGVVTEIARSDKELNGSEAPST